MNAPQRQSDAADSADSACPAACPRCTESAAKPADSEGLAGWRLTLSAMGTFFVPLVLLVAGAVSVPLAWTHPAAQLVGGVGGLLIGAAIAVGVGRRLGRRT